MKHDKNVGVILYDGLEAYMWNKYTKLNNKSEKSSLWKLKEAKYKAKTDAIWNNDNSSWNIKGFFDHTVCKFLWIFAKSAWLKHEENKACRCRWKEYRAVKICVESFNEPLHIFRS